MQKAWIVQETLYQHVFPRKNLAVAILKIPTTDAPHSIADRDISGKLNREAENRPCCNIWKANIYSCIGKK